MLTRGPPLAVSGGLPAWLSLSKMAPPNSSRLLSVCHRTSKNGFLKTTARVQTYSERAYSTPYLPKNAKRVSEKERAPGTDNFNLPYSVDAVLARVSTLSRVRVFCNSGFNIFFLHPAHSHPQPSRSVLLRTSALYFLFNPRERTRLIFHVDYFFFILVPLRCYY